MIFWHQPSFLILSVLLLIVALYILWVPLRLNLDKWLLGLFIFVFCTATIGLYVHWGASLPVTHEIAVQELIYTMQQLNQSQLPLSLRLEALEKLEQKIAYSEVGIAQLAHIYLEMGVWDKAIVQFDKASQLNPKSQDYKVQWIYSHSLQNQGRLPASVRDYALKMIRDDQKLYTVMNLLAIDQYLREEYAQAIACWQHIIDGDQTLSVERKGVLERAMNKAQRHIKNAPTKNQRVAKISKSGDALTKGR